MQKEAMLRLRRKLEVMLLEAKRQTGSGKYDIEECLALLGIIERGKE